MDPVHPASSTTREELGNAVATAALAVVRRSMVEDVPVTREGMAQEALVRTGGGLKTRCAMSRTSPSGSASRRGADAT